MEINRLYVDETGTLNGNTGYYILIGCSIKESNKAELQKLAGQIKFKYWDNDSIVFHSQEIGKCIGAFKNLSDQTIRDHFHKDLYKFLYNAPICIFPVVIDKQEIASRRWGKRKILQTATRALFRNFIIHTLGRQGWTGRITIESSSLDRDYYYHEALNHFKASGIPEATISGKNISDKITSISFVNKVNGDIEEQISDILAYGALCKTLKDKGLKTYTSNSYESNMIKILKAKEFAIDSNTSTSKRAILSKIIPLVIIP